MEQENLSDFSEEAIAVKSVAQILVAMLAAVLTVGACWVGMSTATFPLSKIDVDRGGQLFERRCASCHTTQAGQALSYGPGLERIGEFAQRRVRGMSAEEYLLESILRPAEFRAPGVQGVMPADVSAGLTSDELMSLVGYLMTRHGRLDARQLIAVLEKAEPTAAKTRREIDFVTVEAGRRLYLTKGKCNQCHLLRDVPGSKLLAPSLLQAGHHDVVYLQAAIKHPNQHIVPGYEHWTIVLTSGKLISGRRLRKDGEVIQMLVEQGGSQRVLTIGVDEVEKDADGDLMMSASKSSSMPVQFPKNLSNSEIDQIVSFLKTLR